MRLIFNLVKIDKSGKSKQFHNKRAQISIKGNDEAGLEWVYLYGTADQEVEKLPLSWLVLGLQVDWRLNCLEGTHCPAQPVFLPLTQWPLVHSPGDSD